MPVQTATTPGITGADVVSVLLVTHAQLTRIRQAAQEVITLMAPVNGKFVNPVLQASIVMAQPSTKFPAVLLNTKAGKVVSTTLALQVYTVHQQGGQTGPGVPLAITNLIPVKRTALWFLLVTIESTLGQFLAALLVHTPFKLKLGATTTTTAIPVQLATTAARSRLSQRFAQQDNTQEVGKLLATTVQMPTTAL